MSSTGIQLLLSETSLMGLSRMGCSHSFRTPGSVSRSFLHHQLPASARGRWGDSFLFLPTAHSCLVAHEVTYTRALKLLLHGLCSSLAPWLLLLSSKPPTGREEEYAGRDVGSLHDKGSPLLLHSSSSFLSSWWRLPSPISGRKQNRS